MTTRINNYSQLSGNTFKIPCRVATTGNNIVLAGTPTIDGITVSLNDRVLVKDQTNPATNGIYIVSVGAWQRAVDLSEDVDAFRGINIYINQGTLNANSTYVLNTPNPISLGTTPLSFMQSMTGGGGSMGPQGPTGDTGPTGADGLQGIQGDTGAQGPQGIQGDTGPQGDQGIQGDTGPAGIQGDTGPQGIAGADGPTGPQGDQGLPGDTGPQGDQGIQGDTGPQGIQGDTGPQGIQGDTGAQGIQGDTGPQGIQGDTGADGPTGPAGTEDPEAISKWDIVETQPGLRLPVQSEWEAERLSWSTNDAAGAFGSVLKLPITGERNVASGLISSTNGRYWTSQIIGAPGTDIWILSFGSTSATNSVSSPRARGNAVRLIVDGTFTQQEFDDNYLGQTIEIDGLTYGYVYNTTTQRVWLDRNLGATQVAANSTDTDSLGWLYQWGRGTDGHQIRTSSTTSTLSSTDQPGHGDFILVSTSPFDWRDPQNDNLWQGVDGINNPAPPNTKLVGKNGQKASYLDLLDLPEFTQGPTGPTGEQGIAGDQGPTGPEGPQGIQGDTGAEGIQGDTGAEGPQGIQGDTGAEGPQGIQGDTGAEGPQGIQGDTGAEGPQGIQGDTGAEGPQGIQGDTGPQGIAGDQGPTGPQGDQGLPGDTGPEGPQGIQGDTGPQGIAGDQGPTGEQGPQGIQGDTGPQGIQGDTGAEGPQGIQGDTGAEGPQGIQGDTGAEGPQGIQGDTGPQGDQGLPGDQGDTGPIGPTGAEGADSTVEGPTGPTGAEGPTGPAAAGGGGASTLYIPSNRTRFPSGPDNGISWINQPSGTYFGSNALSKFPNTIIAAPFVNPWELTINQIHYIAGSGSGTWTIRFVIFDSVDGFPTDALAASGPAFVNGTGDKFTNLNFTFEANKLYFLGFWSGTSNTYSMRGYVNNNNTLPLLNSVGVIGTTPVHYFSKTQTYVSTGLPAAWGSTYIPFTAQDSIPPFIGLVEA